jgi:hypothetical protein
LALLAAVQESGAVRMNGYPLEAIEWRVITGGTVFAKIGLAHIQFSDAQRIMNFRNVA